MGESHPINLTRNDLPTPYGPVPSARQLQWHAFEFYGFLHFTVNTFTDKEWGYGDEAPGVFDPSAFDADQIVETADMAGMKGLILTCKHHDGFCLWPSRFTEHSVKNSPWSGGRDDIVKAISEACQRRHLRFGVYLSPWDRNHAHYARTEYITYYRNQLRELLENYGPIFEVWFDGANGGDGYYGGARERREIDRTTYYDWLNTWQIVRDLQPEACMFSDAGPDVRWVGNEKGIAGETCWATLNCNDFVPGDSDAGRLNAGDRPGTHWLPAECDVSIRPGWFYHASEDDRVRSPENLVDLYFRSVGRGASFLLNLPPDRRGQIHDHDVRALHGFRKQIDSIFVTDLAQAASELQSPAWRDDARFGPQNAIDGSRETFWYAGDEIHTPELVLGFDRPVCFDTVGLREYLPLGQRVDAFAIDAWQGGDWREFAAGTSIGSRRLIRGETITTTQVRLRITQAPVCPALAEISLYRSDH
ncbi:MAG: alpha-L-fucosidase [Anaerolineae bacterium]|nr:alpha-L-fucosidase [Anaerolineae bacterium]